MSLRLTGIDLSYGLTRVLKAVDLQAEPGEVHALLGANGAGKSSLIKCIVGAARPDRGTIELDGEALRDLTPSRAYEHGIAVIHQHLSLVDVLSVVDNLFLGHELRRGPAVRRGEQLRAARHLLEQFGLDAPLTTRVGDLPIGTKQLLEIAKAWHGTQVRVMVLDEPTASLSEEETRRLFVEVERMRKDGARIIYITHRLSEVFEIADRVTVLRDGEVALAEPVAALDAHRLIATISDGAQTSTGTGRRPGATVLEVEELTGERFGPVSLAAREHEVLGLYGVLGSGRTSILETLAGRFRSSGGVIRLLGKKIDPRSPRRAIRAGVVLVPGDRRRQALWATRPAADNVLVPWFGRFAAGPLRRVRRESFAFRDVARKVDLKPSAPKLAAGLFSGGNQQKLVLGRWVTDLERLRLLLLDEPTQGVDIGARQKIYDVCRQLSASGVGVVFASTDASEVVAFADRAVVIDHGRVKAEFEGERLTEQALVASAHQLSDGGEASSRGRTPDGR